MERDPGGADRREVGTTGTDRCSKAGRICDAMIEKQRQSPSHGPIVGGAAESAAAPVLRRAADWKRRHQLIGLLFLLPALVFVAVFYVYPILLNIVMSFERYTARSFVTGEAPFI